MENCVKEILNFKTYRFKNHRKWGNLIIISKIHKTELFSSHLKATFYYQIKIKNIWTLTNTIMKGKITTAEVQHIK